MSADLKHEPRSYNCKITGVKGLNYLVQSKLWQVIAAPRKEERKRHSVTAGS